MTKRKPVPKPKMRRLVKEDIGRSPRALWDTIFRLVCIVFDKKIPDKIPPIPAIIIGTKRQHCSKECKRPCSAAGCWVGTNWDFWSKVQRPHIFIDSHSSSKASRLGILAHEMGHAAREELNIPSSDESFSVYISSLFKGK